MHSVGIYVSLGPSSDAPELPPKILVKPQPLLQNLQCPLGGSSAALDEAAVDCFRGLNSSFAALSPTKNDLIEYPPMEVLWMSRKKCKLCRAALHVQYRCGVADTRFHRHNGDWVFAGPRESEVEKGVSYNRFRTALPRECPGVDAQPFRAARTDWDPARSLERPHGGAVGDDDAGGQV